MDRAVLVEGILLIVLSLAGVVEGCRLIINRDPTAILDMMGPGSYVLFMSLALMITGAAHVICHYRKRSGIERAVVDHEMRKKMISMILVLAGYLLFIEIAGYLVPTVLFFLLEFRIAGIKSWMTNIVLSVVVTAVYFVVFVQYCSMVFPRGILFE